MSVETGNRLELLDLALDDSFDGHNYHQLWQRYELSPYGKHHAASQLPRYSQVYGYDPAQMIQDLGSDVHPVRHMLHTDIFIAKPFIIAQTTQGHEQFDRQQIIGLRLGANLHDIGECTHPHIEEVCPPIGDVHYEDKQAAHAEQEKLIRTFLYQKLYADLPPAVLEQVEQTIDGEETFEQLAFNTIERIGYFQTAMRAGELALKLSEQEPPTQRTVNLARLAIRVAFNHRQILQARAERFPHVERVLKASAKTDELVQAELPDYVDSLVAGFA